MSNTFTATQLSCIRQQRNLFTDLSFKLTAGEMLLIEGDNGSGKSSLLRILTGLSTPTSGDVYWEEKSIYRMHANYAKQMHYIAHANGIKLGLTVTEHLRLAKVLTQNIPHQSSDTILSALQLTQFTHLEAKLLSAGQKRRLALAKLFLFPKLIWILDEPLTSLDTTTQALFLSQLITHLNNGGIAIISSHQSSLFEKIMAHRLRLLLC